MKKFTCSIAFSLITSSCNTTMLSTPLPQEFIYSSQLTSIPAELTATIEGSEQTSSGWSMDKQRVFIKRIDGKLTQADPTSCKRRYLLAT